MTASARFAPGTGLCILALCSFAQENDRRFPGDRITQAQWSTFRDEVLAKTGMERRESANQLVVTVPAESAIYVFTQPAHPAHPAVVVRRLMTVDGGTSINRMGHFAGNEQAFAAWWKTFDSLDAAVKNAAGASGTTGSSGGGAVLKSAAESRAVQEDIRKLTESHFRLLTTGQFDAALAQVDPSGMGGDAAGWVKSEQSFQSISGAPVSMTILKVTVYDNPQGAPRPGLYVAADFRNAYANVPFQCGYLMWFREPNGTFRITRQEKGHATAEQLKRFPLPSTPKSRGD